ncbi:MAG TPA: hypothetical protein VGM76_00605 [Lacipirellulaceae bacterium]|jgi:hypothetical protein
MSGELKPAAAQPEPTEARFSIRALFVATGVVAVIAAVVGPLVRSLQPDAQLRLLIAWGAWLAATIVWIGYQARERASAECSAGKSLLRLPMFDEKLASASPERRWINFGGAILLTLLLLTTMSHSLVNSPNPLEKFNLLDAAFTILFAAWWLARLVSICMWRNNVRFCESGVLWDQQVLLWDHIIEQRWNGSNGVMLELKGIDQHGVERLLKIPVPIQQQAAVQAILDAKAAHGPSMPRGPLIHTLVCLPLSTSVRRPWWPRYTGAVLVFAAFVGALYLAGSSLSGIRGFDSSILIGILLAGATGSWWWRRTGKLAGPALARLSGRRDALALLLILPAAGAFFVIGQSIGWSYPWVAYATGTGFGFTVVVAATYAFGKQLDLRANGLVLKGACYWPWAQVRVTLWDSEKGGRLVFARGWRRIVGWVPTEQRAAVDALLKEKLANPIDAERQTG